MFSSGVNSTLEQYKHMDMLPDLSVKRVRALAGSGARN